MPELTPEQIKEDERKRRKGAWNRTYARRKYEREKAAGSKLYVFFNSNIHCYIVVLLFGHLAGSQIRK